MRGLVIRNVLLSQRESERPAATAGGSMSELRWRTTLRQLHGHGTGFKDSVDPLSTAQPAQVDAADSE